MLHRYLFANATLADRWGHLLYWLFEGMAQDWRRRGLRHVHHGEICQRVMGLWKRLRTVLEQYRAGTLRAVQRSDTSRRPPPQSGAGEGRAACAKRAVAGWSVLPRRFGWLKSLILPDRQHCVMGFSWLLYGDAEMLAVIAAAPLQVGRILRPFCHFLGLELPEELRLPKRVRKKDTSPRPSPQSGEGEERAHARAAAARRRDARSEMIVPNRRLPPAEQVDDAVRRSEAFGKSIEVKKFKPVAFGIFLHPPRDGNCPPPEIGYGGRRPRPPRDYKPPRDD